MAEKDFSLDKYRSKRDFAKTPEPAPAEPLAAEAELRDFVIHRHEARNLHYDLRLEMEGVLKSWAVPKGLSWVPADKHLAVRTEDHPIEYLTFDGVIPKGQYGAGAMTIWDRGTYRVTEGDGLDGLDDGKLEIELRGGRVRGQWHMVRLAKSDKDWLLFKYRDRYAREEGEPVFPLDLSREKPAKIPRSVKTMRPAQTADPFSDAAWVFELKFAGVRMTAAVDGGGVRFADASGKTAKWKLSELEGDLRRLRAERAVLDGVLVASDEADRPDADLLAQRLAAGDTEELRFYVFDLLHYEDWDLRERPLLQRKSALASVVPKSARVLYVDHVVERGEELADLVARRGLAGVIAKRGDSPYAAGPSDDWKEIRAAESTAPATGSVHDALAKGGSRRPSRVKFSNRNKIYWPVEGITKGQLLDWYDRMADVIVPYLRDRPVHMLRYPDGIEGKSFYHKNVAGRMPDWVKTVVVKEEGGEEVRYVVCNDRDTLLQLVNLGSIDLHPWLSRTDEPEMPDWAIIDLDPSDDDFSKPVRIARTVGKVLHGAGLRPSLKTSGKTGLHIYVPLVRKYSYEQARMFCEVVARMAVVEHKDIATVERTPAKRGSKVYVDYGQNRREQTVVPPYVVRPVPGASVSAPLDWDELSGRVQPADFNLETVPERLERLGDLFRGALTDLQELEPAIEALGNR
ncbi:MAG TPA: non-homologous end-joining DNA ligase [bacterium]|nr:non-homologous end-joining DNA ligase [bacterium]